MSFTPTDKQVAAVFETKDYGKFKHLEGNREIVIPHLRRLRESMLKKYLFAPVLINEHYEIIDGQHRYEICKEHGLPLRYMMQRGYKLPEVQILNSNLRNWGNDEYLNGYIELGLEDYKLYKTFREEFGLDHHSCLWLLSDEPSSKETWFKFKTGEFKVKNYKKAVDAASKIKSIAPYYKGYSRRSFVAAMIKCFRDKKYNHDVFLRKLSFQQTKMVDCAKTEDYLNLIMEIYNYKTTEAHKIDVREK